jgi:hypothetical protein
MKLTDKVRRQAERTVELTLEEAKALPNMLGRIAPGMMAYHGFYSATVGGVKMLFIAKGPEFAALKTKAESLIK